MPSPLKRPIPGRLGRLLASLRPPARAGPLPVQTGFPTSLADLVVKNHDRLKKPRRRRPTTAAAPSSPAPPAAAVVETLPELPSRRELSPDKDKVAVAVRLRPELLGVGAAAALALLVIWSRWLVAAVTVPSLSLFWIESVRLSSYSRRRPRSRPPAAEAATVLPDLSGRGAVSPIREVESESAAATPRSSCSAESDKGSEVSVSVSVPSLLTDERSQLDDGGDSTTHPKKRKEKKRWLRKLIAKKKPKKKKDCSVSSHGEAKQPDADEVVSNAVAEEAFSVASTAEQQQPPSEPADGPRGGALPFVVFVPVVLVGLVAGKLPAVALTVICAVFFSSVERRDHQLALVMN
ncbi:hypothetical protein E2562_008053 [Oryza meyeriana var. granulata]|uniref:Uncharacterized protein n=1 Tax=Oryza meyeriana var. granulata TaxID=110450 RepID=A0A6G1DFA5_9ORYZ|nr:hypothetical protein E2562_008053 [Oryza meyeriana var. granulata]